MRPVKSLVAGMVVGLVARDCSWLSTTFLVLSLAVVLYVWDFLTLVAKEEVWVPMTDEQERLVGMGRMFGRLGFFSFVLDATVIALAAVLTCWVVDRLWTSP